MSEKQLSYFAVRRLSPFQGTSQVIEAGNGQATSNNGIDWRIQVCLHTPLNQKGSLDGSHPDQQIILFGFWSSEGGFHRVPLPPMVSSRQIEVAAQAILDELLAITRNVPFKQVDCCELWLLDEYDLSPLALIASSSNPENLPHLRRLEWQATQLSDHSFTRTWSKTTNDEPGHAARDKLNALINKSAGQNPQAQWFLRSEDGKGAGIEGINLNDKFKNRCLEKDDFPELLLKNHWQDKTAQELIDDYVGWQAPFLLTLSDLNVMTRKRLEQLAFRQPFKVEGQHKLWPEVIDKDKLKAVLIEAQMRRSNPDAGNK